MSNDNFTYAGPAYFAYNGPVYGVEGLHDTLLTIARTKYFGRYRAGVTVEGNNTSIVITHAELVRFAGIIEGFIRHCKACEFEAEFGTNECPHPVDRRMHTCRPVVEESSIPRTGSRWRGRAEQPLLVEVTAASAEQVAFDVCSDQNVKGFSRVDGMPEFVRLHGDGRIMNLKDNFLPEVVYFRITGKRLLPKNNICTRVEFMGAFQLEA